MGTCMGETWVGLVARALGDGVASAEGSWHLQGQRTGGAGTASGVQPEGRGQDSRGTHSARMAHRCVPTPSMGTLGLTFP